MNRTGIVSALLLTLTLGLAGGFVAGNHHAALQSLNELQMISRSAYEAADDITAKRIFARHHCGVLDRRIAALRNPFSLFHERSGSYEPERRSRTDILRDLERERAEWETPMSTPNKALQAIGAPGAPQPER